MRLGPPSNADLLAWFSDEERHVCGSCRALACVSFPDVPASFCLACRAITLNGVRLDS